MNIITKKQIYTAFLLLPYFFAFTGMLVLDSGDKKLIPLILVSIIISLFSLKIKVVKNNLSSPFIWLILMTCIYAMFSYYYHGSSSREIRALIGSTLFLLIFPYKLLSKKIIRTLILLGSITLCINSIYFNVYIGIERDAGYINPIPYATIVALLATIAFSLLIENSNIKEKRLPFISFILCIPPLILSEARGVWFAFSVTIFTVYIFRLIKRPQSKTQVVSILLTSTLILSFGGYLFKDKLSHRYYNTIEEIKKINEGNYETSIGFRIQMWELAPDLIQRKPILGHGQHHEKILKERLEEQSISNSLYYFASSHYHNQFIDKAVKSGFVGLILIIALLLYPLKKVTFMEEYEKYITISFVTLLFTSGLTDVPFNHPQPLVIYLLFLVPICSRCKRVTDD